METTIKVSVIVPAYNAEEWLPRCLDSIVSQTYTNLEIIVINDGSTDGTQQVLKKYADKDPRIVAINQDNAGLVAVREKGIAVATGEYVGFVDGDDTVAEDMYERLVRNAVEHQADISQCGMLYCFYDGRRKPMHGTNELKIYDTVQGLKALLRGVEMEPSLCNKIYKKALLADSCLDLSVVNNEDLLRNFVLFGRASKSVFEDFCGYEYWRRAESMSNNKTQVKNQQHIIRARQAILEHATKDVYAEAYNCYISALVTSYNATIGNKENDAKAFGKQCKAALRKQKGRLQHADKAMKIRANMILYCPFIYDVFYRLHRKYIFFKIRQAQKKQ